MRGFSVIFIDCMGYEEAGISQAGNSASSGVKESWKWLSGADADVRSFQHTIYGSG